MKFTLDSPGNVSVRSVSADGIRVADQLWQEAVVLASSGEAMPWTGSAFANVDAEELEPLLATGVELVVIGTGDRQLLPDRSLMFAMARRSVGLEVMDTAAAARTFNVLIAEGRNVAALLFPA